MTVHKVGCESAHVQRTPDFSVSNCFCKKSGEEMRSLREIDVIYGKMEILLFKTIFKHMSKI